MLVEVAALERSEPVARVAITWKTSGVTVILSLDDVETLAHRVLLASGASPLQADATARSVRDGEADGIRNVALGYLPTYADHLACGKVVGHAVPTLERPRPAVVAVDARHGFAHPAFELGAPIVGEVARSLGIGLLTISHSYSAGILGWFVERLADEGLVALMFANSSSTMAPWGGKAPFFGTNPIAWGVPRVDGPALVADLSSSAVAWVTVNDAAASGRPIPLGWALDPAGEPTTDAAAGLAGTIAPSGGHKGSALALLVDLLAGGLTGSSFSFEASGFGDNAGGPPDVGQTFLVVDPSATAGPGFAERVEEELVAMTAQPGVRLPGDRRVANRALAEESGVEVPDDLFALLSSYAESGSPATRSGP